jgi:hypothetical protein
MTKATRAQYTLEFKQEAVRMVESGHAGVRSTARLEHCGAGEGGRSGASQRELREKVLDVGCGAPPRNRRGAGVAPGPLGPIGGRPGGDAPGTQPSRGRVRIADRSAGSNDAHRASHGRSAGRIRRVRARDPARAGSRRIGSCPAEWEAPGAAAYRGAKSRPGAGTLSPWRQ